MRNRLIEPLQTLVDFLGDEDLRAQCGSLSEETQKSVCGVLQQVMKQDLEALVSITSAIESNGDTIAFTLQAEGGEAECRVTSR